MPAFLLRLRGGGLSRFLAAAALVGFAAVGFAADAFAQGNPRAPLNFSATPTGNNAVALSWTRDQKGSSPFWFIITYGRDGGAVTLDGVTYSGGGTMTVDAGSNHREVVSGLAGYEEYRFTVRAAGYTWRLVLSPAVSAVATPVSPPFAPSVSVVAGEGKISLHLTRRGLAPVESFVVSVLNADYLSAWQAGVSASATLSADFVVAPLFDLYPPSSGDAYTVVVRANNANGAGMPATITANPLFGAPAAPETVVAAPLPGAVSLRWRQNWNHGGGGFINAYIVSWSGGGQSGGATINADGDIASDAGVLSSLVPANRQLSVAGWRSAVVQMPGGATVTVEIRAHSRSPYSPQSRQLGAPASVVVTALAEEYGLRNFLATAGDGRVTLTWETKDFEAVPGDLPPDWRLWTRLARPNQTYTLVANDHLRSDETFHTVILLAPNGEPLDFQLLAVYSQNEAYYATATATPYAFLPPALAATPLPSGVEVSLVWSPPNLAGKTIASYQLSLGNNAFATLSGAAAHTVIGGLQKNTEYAFALRAVASNGGGGGLYATVFVTTQTTPPGGVANLQALAGDDVLSLSWRRPQDTGGYGNNSVNDLRYFYQYQFLGASVLSRIKTRSARVGVAVPNLPAGVLVTFGVWAQNIAGDGPLVFITAAGVATASISLPGAVASLRALPAGGGASLFWRRPASNGGYGIDGKDDLRYRYSHEVFGQRISRHIKRVSLSLDVAEPNLPPNVVITFAVEAQNIVGYGEATSVVITTNAGAPWPANNFRAEFRDRGAVLFWDPPLTDGGAPLSYLVSYGSSLLVGAASSTGATTATVSNLSNGEPAVFELRLSNSLGASPPTRATVTPAGPPLAPTLFAATDHTTAILLYWSPANDNGRPLLRYELTHGGEVSVLAASVTGVFIGGLAKGTQYSFELRAVNALGKSPPARLSQRTSHTQAGPVVSLRARPIDRGVVFTFYPPLDDGGMSIDTYVVSIFHNNYYIWYSGGNTPPNQITISAVYDPSVPEFPYHTGVPYDFYVYACNLRIIHTNNSTHIFCEETGEQTRVQVRPGDVPSAPQSVVVTPLQNAFWLDWRPPAHENGNPVTVYKLRAGGETYTLPASSPQRRLFANIDGDEIISVTLRAVNASGEGVAVTARGFRLQKPGQPQSLRASAGIGVATLFWRPAFNGGASLNAHYILVNQTIYATLNGAALTATITGLAYGEPHEFVVAAQNSIGVTTGATVGVTVLPRPPAPSLAYFNIGAVVPNSHNGEVTLFWSRVGDGFGGAPYYAPIVGYTVEYSGGATINGEAFGVLAKGFGQDNATTTLQSRVLGDLTGHVPYEFVIRAIASVQNAPGESRHVLGLPKTIAVTAVSRPYTPSVSASGGNGNVTFYIKRRGPAPVSRFVIKDNNAVYLPRLRSEGITALAPANVADEITVVFGPLKRDTTGAPHTFYVVAFNSVGESAVRTAYERVGQGPANSPASVFISAAYRGFALRWWQDPRFEGGGLKEFFYIDYGTEGTVGNAQVDVYNNPITIGIGDLSSIYEDEPAREWYSVVVTGLVKNGFYTVGIRTRTRENKLFTAINFTSFPPAMATIAPFNAPQAPRELSLAGFNQGVSLFWGPFTVGYDGFSSVLRYELETAGATLTLPAAMSVASFVGLTNGITHSYTMRAFNAFGAGEPFAAGVLLGYHPPSAPLSLSVQEGDTSLTLRWQAPANDADAAITAYILRVNGALSLTVGGGARSLIARGFVNGERYTLALAAQNSAGIGATATIVGRPLTKPGAPVSLRAQDGDRQIALRWLPPPDNGGASVTGYIVEHTEGALSLAGGANLGVTLTALTNGAPVAASVFAVNRGGRGAASAPVVATAATTASAPTSLQAAEGDGVITLAWNAPNNNGGATITAYAAEWGGQSELVFGVSLVVSGLTNGETVFFTIRARNRKGLGAAAGIAAAGRGKPSAPTAVNAVGSNGNITLTWNAPTNNNGAAVTAYIVSYKGIATATQGRSFTLSGLSAGETVRFTVRAVNSVGAGDGATAEGIARDAPAAPTNLSAQRGNGAATLTWGAPAQLNGATLRGYEIVYGGQTQSVGANATGYTATGLSNGITYEFRVYAKSDYGNGAAAIATAKPATTPSAPAGLRAAFANSAITLQWDLVTGAASGGEPVTAYIIRHGANKAATVGAVNSAVVGGLTNGETITFSVYAANAAGESAAPATISEYANTTPAAPTGLQAQDGNAVITLQWSAPSNNGGAAVTGYVVEYTGGTLTAAANRATLTGLTNGDAITAKVFAVNRGGRGAAFAPVVATAATTPAAPTGLPAQDGDGVITLQWTPPSDNGGAAVTGYIVEYTGGALMAATNRATLTGLANGAPITAKIFAVNRVGGGAASAPITATAATTASAPISLQAAEGDGVVTLIWNAPANNGGATITAYVAEWGGQSTLVFGSSLVVSGLANGETITFAVGARNRKGRGAPASIAAAGRGKPSAPTNVFADGAYGVVTLTWGAPANNGGATVTAYIVSYKGAVATAQGLSYTLSGLFAGETVAFTVQAQNSVGIGDGATAQGVAREAPAAPTNLRARRDDALVSLTWGAPTIFYGSQLLGYEVAYGGQRRSVGASATGYVATGLTNGAAYEFYVYAKSDHGNGATATATATPLARPSAPTSFVAADPPLAEKIVLTWSEAASVAAMPPVLFYVVDINGAATLTLAAAARAATLEGLVNGKIQTLDLRAKNSVGLGAAARLTAAAQGVPRALVVRGQPQIRAAILSVDFSPEEGDSAVTSYIVEHHRRKIDISGYQIDFHARQFGLARFAVPNLLWGWHNFTVFARNKYGESEKVTVRRYVIPGIPPPRNLHAKTGDRVVTLIWQRPLVSDEIIAYFIGWGYRPDYSERYDFYPNVYDPGPFTAVVSTHLTNSIEQRFIMQAAALNPDAFHAAHYITFYATPGFPPGDIPFFAASSNFDGRIPIVWGEAANEEGSPLTGYELSYNGVIQTLAPAARSAALEGLVNGQTHSLTLRAASTSGRGPPIVAIATPRAPPTPPTSLAAAGAHGAITVIWGAPQNDNGASVTAYFIAYKSATATVAGLALTLSNLSAGETLTFVARAANSIGISDAATAAAIVYDSPSAPTNLRAQRGNGAATITWGAPTRLNGSRLRGYWLDYGGQRQSLDANARAHTATALANGAVYLFSLYANSEYGNGATATASAKPATTPAAPANLRAAFADRAIALQWVLATTAPANGGEPVTAYIIRYGANQEKTTGAVASVVVSGLVNGEALAFSVYAVNALGESATPATVNEYPNTTPAAPASLRALAGDGVVTLTWSPPANTGGAAITGYEARWGGRYIRVSVASVVVSGLANGGTVTFAVGARNRGGLGAMASVAAVPRGKPSAPTNLNAIGAPGVITLTWNAPANDNGATVTGYAISYKATATTTASRGFTLSNLFAGETVNFTVRAINRLGAGAGAIAQGIASGDAPNAPTNLRARRGNGAVTLLWGAPAGLHGVTPTGYEVVYDGQTQSVGASVTTHTATGLTNGAVYWFSVYAKSDYGNGAAAFVSAKPATTPAAPASLRAAFADGAIALQWALVTGAANGGEPVTAHVVRYGANKATTVGAVASAVIAGLSNGEIIAFSVYAVNAAGEGVVPATISEYASGAPAAPTGLLAQDGDGAITLQWGAPANNGGAAVTGYVVEYTGGLLTTSSSVFRATLTGVANGAPITASVFAVNRGGLGAASAPITATAATTPAAPANLRAAAGDGVATLTWSAPANTGGAVITAYAAEWGGRSTLVSDAFLVVFGLTNGEPAGFTLRARNRKGLGAAASVVAVAVAAPSAPTNVAAAGAYGVITLTWGAPAKDNGATITAYRISYKNAVAAVAAAARSFTLSNLSAGETVDFAVQAQNSVGVGEGATAQGVARDAPSAPTNLRAQRGNGAVTLLWGAPARLNGAALRGYEVAYNGQTQSVGANATSHAAAGLNNGEAYNFGVYAKSDYGNGATATASATPATTPVTPANLRAAFADAAITLRWNLATGADTGGAPITTHIIDYVENKETIFHLTGNTIRYFINRAATVGAVDSAVIAGLSNGDTVSFSVYAVNAAGRSAAPATISEYASAAPAAPTSLLAQDGNAVITAQWGAPANNGGAAITGYVVEYTGGAIMTSPAGRGVTLTGVANGAPIAISVFAFNRAGRGAASAITATAATTPAAPASLQAQDGDGAITLQWGAPANNGGATVTGYVVEHTGGTATASVAAIAITGLTNGEPITAKVFAINRVGIGAASAPITATAATTASAPISLQAAEGDGVVTLTWGAPANNGGATITAYSAEWGGQSTLVFGSSLVVSGLTNGETITFAVGARNRKGAGAAASVAAAGRGKPSAPTSVFADGAYGVVTLTWGAPANNGGATVTAYVVNYKGAAAEAEAAGRSFTLSGLFAGETVAFTVRAVNSLGVGAGATAEGIARDAPAAPTSLRALRGDGVATLTWAAPARLNGATVRGYEVLYDGQTQSVGASATAHTATALNNGVEYEFRIYAKSDYGDGATATARATPAARPATPANLRAAFADGAITLQWDLATAAVAEPVTGYVVRYGATAKILGAVASVVVDGLTNGETITFSVYAVNAVGESALPATISEYASATPAAPTGLQAQDGNGVITLQWSAPANNGGAAITAHIVEYTGGAITATTTRATLTGLNNGDAITAKVFAVNRGGRGAASAPVVATAATTPAAPASLQAAEGDGVVTLTWNAPASNGGATITAYMAEWSGRSSLVLDTSLAVSGLTNGETVSFTLRARNRKGLGAAASIAAAGRGKPSAPTGVNAVGSNGNITVTWNAPANDNGAAVTAYIISYKGTMAALQGRSFTLSDLSAGETVRFTVQAVNSVGASDGATAEGIARDAPTAPTSLSAQRGNGLVTLTWGAPAQLNGATLQGYEIAYGSETQSVGANATGYTATGLSNGTEYEFRVYAKSDYGNGAAAITTAKPATTPSAPASLRAAFADSAITLQWDLATGANTGGEPVTAYIIRHGAKASTVGAVNSAVIGSLTNGETIAFSVYAVNAVGESALPATISEYPNTTPAAPTGLQAQDGNGVITLQWSAPSDNGGATITAYIVEYTGGILTATAARATLTGLTNGDAITAKVFAVNRGGRGAASAPVVATAATTPAAPTGLQAQDGNGVITLQWSAPADSGGATITAYIVEYTGGTLTAATNRATLTGLSNGDAITAKVFAVNRVGGGAASSPVVATAATTASAPTSLQVAEGDGVVTLTWGAPSNTGGAAVTAYMAEWGGQSTLISDVSLVVLGLTNGETVSFTLRALNRKGAGVAASIAAAGRGKPSAPTAVNAVGSNGNITVTWNAPANDNGAAVTSYIVSYNGTVTAVQGRGFTLSGLSAGETVRFTVQAVNSVGVSDGATAEGIARDAPTAPTNLSAQRGNGVVTLTWGAPAQLNGATLQGYEIAYGSETQSVGANATSYTATGLSNGTEYEFRVYAKSDYGDGAAAITTAKPATTPSAPANLRAAFADSAITLQWDLATGATNGGDPVTAYIIRHGAKAATVGAINSAVIGNLTNGETVVFSVYAVNAVGESATPATISEYPNTTPAAPTGLQAQDGNGVITLQWTAPSDNGGAAITGYVVEYTGGTLTAATNRATLAGLTNGAPITAKVFAVNRGGRGAASAPVVVTAATTPAAPTGLQAQDGNGVITLQWAAPSDNGGAAIIGYVVEYTGGEVTATTNRATLTGLTNGDAITAKVFAINRVGGGAASSPVVATAATTASAPTNLQVAEGDGVVTLTWGAPSNTGGAAVTAYMAEWVGQSSLVLGASLIVSGLTNGETVSFTLRARNRKGLGVAASIAAAGRGKPSAPTGVNAVGSNGNITVTWNAPANDNGAAVTAYIVSYKDIATAVQGRGFTLSGLSAGETVRFTVQAVNSVGVSEGATAEGIARDAPTAPTNLSAQRGNGAVTLTWGAPAQLNGAVLQGYEIVYGGQTQSVGANATGYTATGLSNGTEYEFRVYAKSDYGNGAAAITTAKPATTPSAPANLRAAFADRAITLQWDLATGADTGGEPVTAYIIRYGANKAATVGAVNSTVVGNLTNGETIAFSVYAVNAVGESATPATISEYPNTTPAAPTGLQAQDGNGVITLQWSAPSNNGGAAVTGYVVEYTGGTLTAATNRATLTGLTNGDAITVKVFAVNRIGGGAKSSPVVATAAATASAPTNLQAAEDNGVVTLTWGAPSNTGGAAVTAYMAEWGGQSTLVSDVSLVVSGLTNGETVSFTIRARNRKGLGAAASIAAAGRGKPDAPTGVNAVGSNGNITVTWNAPANDNGAAVTGYIVSYKGIATAVQGRGFTLSGLSAGETVRFTVQAVNSIGISDGATAEGIARDAPTAPTNLEAQRGNGVVTLTWGAPAQLNGAALEGYEIVYGGQTQSVGANATGYTATGLSNGTEYEFRVYAKSDYGNGAAAITTAKPATTPNAPVNLRAAFADSAITLQWGLVSGADTGGEPVTAYIIGYGENKAATVGAVNFVVVENLTNGEVVAFSVYAVNAVGKSAAPATINEYASAPPGAPQNLRAQTGDGVITLQWSAPVDNGGATITGYIVEYTGGALTLTAAALPRATLTDLTNGAEITMRVFAVNRAGRGAASAPSSGAAATTPAAVTALFARGGDKVIELNWSAPNDGGAEITRYVLYVNGAETLSVAGITRSAALGGLTNGQEYTLGIRAENSVGLGPMAQTTQTPASRPGAPQGFSVVAGNGELALFWRAPASDGGAPITAYIAFVNGAAVVTLSEASRAVTLDALTNGKTYTLGLAAANRGGAGAQATASETPYTVPAKPRNVFSKEGEGRLTVFWQPPASNNGRPVLDYAVSLASADGAATMTVAAADVLSARFAVGASALYSVYVRARNLAGYGAWALAVDEGDFLLEEEEERRTTEADNSMLPAMAGALSRRWGKALGGRLGAGGGAGGTNLRALGANFSPDNATRGVAELLRKHGGAIANGEKIDESALREAQFAFLPGSGNGNGGGKGAGVGGAGAPALGKVGLWGGASYTNLKDEAGEILWDGRHSNYHAGIERALDDNRLVGVMLTRDEIKTKYRTQADGDYRTYNLRAGGAHPYFLWNAPDGGRRLWAAFGYAAGKAQTAAGAATKTRDLRAYSAFGGYHGLLWSDKSGGVLDLQADAAAARVEVKNGGGATAHNLRALLEARREFRDTDGNAFLPFLRAGARLLKDGEGVAAGWEALAGMRWTNAAGWRAELAGGASGLSNGQKEWSVEGALSKRADALGKGLALDLRAQYGGNAKDVNLRGDFWRPLVAEDNAGGGGFGFGADLGYGITRAGALWRPYFGATFGAGGEYRAGLAWRQLLRADVEARAGMEAKRLHDKTQLNVNMGVNY